MKAGIKSIVILLLAAVIVNCGACTNGKKTKTTKVKDIEYTVVEEADLPEEILKLVEERKEQPFKMSYGSGDYLYIITGYGKKETGGYSIKVNDLYLTENAIYFNTDLLGPVESEKVEYAESYPYIVVKMEYMDKSIVFE